MKPPLVGVAGEELVVRKHFGDQRVAAAPVVVLAAIRDAGGEPVVLPPDNAGAVGALDALDALVLSGGPDLGTDPARDASEQALLAAARSAGLPTLGICRGLQLMAVGTGGTLVEELGDAHVVEPPGSHPLVTVPGSVVAGLVPQGRVGSLHHQAVATYGERWRCTAAAPDGVVEALEWPDQRAWPALGVQWHPELDPTGPAVFGWLVRSAGRPARSQSTFTCLSALYSPFTYRHTGTGTVAPPNVTAS